MCKKIFIVSLVAVLTVNYAQAQVIFGARAGFNMTNLYQKDANGDKVGLDWRPGFQIGVIADYPFLFEDLSIQPGILFATQGAKSEKTLLGYKTKINFNLNYIQVPINLQYKQDLDNMILLLQAGPYLGFGIGGKKEIEISEGGTKVSSSEKIKFGSGDDADFKAFDFGLGFGAGLQFGNLQAVLSYNLGLVKLDPDVDLKNIGLALTVTYFFGK